MTLAFTFPIKDAWVVVADRLIIKKDGTPNSLYGEEKIRVDHRRKIEYLPSKDLVFVGSGDFELLEEFIKIINLKSSLDEFNSSFQEICSSLNSSKFQISVKKTDFILINQQNLRAYKYCNGKRYEILSDLKHSFIGAVEGLKNLNNAKRKLIRRVDYNFNLRGCLINELIYILEDLSVQRLDSIGHPSIEGCDIWIIKKRKIRKFPISPKGYTWREL